MESWRAGAHVQRLPPVHSLLLLLIFIKISLFSFIRLLLFLSMAVVYLSFLYRDLSMSVLLDAAIVGMAGNKWGRTIPR
jgi:hypothetical protein